MCRGISASNCPKRTELHWQSNQIHSNQIISVGRTKIQRRELPQSLRLKTPSRMSRSVTTEEGYWWWWWSDLCCFVQSRPRPLAVGSQCQCQCQSKASASQRMLLQTDCTSVRSYPTSIKIYCVWRAMACLAKSSIAGRSFRASVACLMPLTSLLPLMSDTCLYFRRNCRLLAGQDSGACRTLITVLTGISMCPSGSIR